MRRISNRSWPANTHSPESLSYAQVLHQWRLGFTKVLLNANVGRRRFTVVQETISELEYALSSLKLNSCEKCFVSSKVLNERVKTYHLNFGHIPIGDIVQHRRKMRKLGIHAKVE